MMGFMCCYLTSCLWHILYMPYHFRHSFNFKPRKKNLILNRQQQKLKPSVFMTRNIIYSSIAQTLVFINKNALLLYLIHSNVIGIILTFFTLHHCKLHKLNNIFDQST